MKSLFSILLFASLAALTCIHGKEESRLLGGTVATSRYPYQVSLQIRAGSGWRHFCGGAIVTRRHVVTAAHCLNRNPPGDFSVLAGTNRLNGNDGRRFLVQTTNYHRQFVSQVTADIGIVTVQGVFAFGSTINAIAYSNRTFTGGVQCVLTGWGATINRDSPPPNDLRQIYLTTISTQQCVNSGQPRVTYNQICTQPPRGSGSCGGDSGGPLAWGNLLVGVVSYGPTNCGNGIPDVYTRVAAYYDWILNNTQ